MYCFEISLPNNLRYKVLIRKPFEVNGVNTKINQAFRENMGQLGYIGIAITALVDWQENILMISVSRT